MRDTTTITPEERAKLISHVNSGYMTMSGEGLKRALEALEQAEARAEKAEAMVDWLAEKCAMHCRDKDRDDILCSDDACDISSITCFGASACDWKEAARRAVAAGEEACQK